MGRYQSHQGGGLASARRPLQQDETALPEHHFPDRLPLSLVEGLLEVSQDAVQQLAAGGEYSSLLLEEGGVQDGGGQLGIVHVADCLVLAHMR